MAVVLSGVLDTWMGQETSALLARLGERRYDAAMVFAALVLGVLSVVLCWVPVASWALALLAIVLGAIAVRRGQRTGLAIAGVVAGVVGGGIGAYIRLAPEDPHARRLKELELEHARETVDTYAHQAYPQWAAAHPGGGCPERMQDLEDFAPQADRQDPWLNFYDMRCGNLGSGGQRAIVIMSAGPDGKGHTDDDIIVSQPLQR